MIVMFESGCGGPDKVLVNTDYVRRVYTESADTCTIQMDDRASVLVKGSIEEVYERMQEPVVYGGGS